MSNNERRKNTRKEKTKKLEICQEKQANKQNKTKRRAQVQKLILKFMLWFLGKKSGFYFPGEFSPNLFCWLKVVVFFLRFG